MMKLLCEKRQRRDLSSKDGECIPGPDEKTTTGTTTAEATEATSATETTSALEEAPTK